MSGRAGAANESGAAEPAESGCGDAAEVSASGGVGVSVSGGAGGGSGRGGVAICSAADAPALASALWGAAGPALALGHGLQVQLLGCAG